MKYLILAALTGFTCACSARRSSLELEEKRRAQLELQSVQDMVSSREIPPVEFEFDSWTLLPTSDDLLGRVAQILKRYPKLKLIVNGHTDYIGTEEYNEWLSLKRAGAVKQRLAEMGIYPDSVKVFGFGKSRPITQDTSDRGRALNRRVEFIITTRHWESVY
jgi:outer membrane protein OmpA-like peptidoglycan-associated protein